MYAGELHVFGSAPSPHQVLWAALLQLVQLSVHIRQVLVDAVHLRLQVFVLVVVAVELVLVGAALLLVRDRRELAAERKRDGFNVLSGSVAFASSASPLVGFSPYLSKSSSSSSSPEEL